MKAFFWVSTAAAGLFALLLGLYVHFGLEDAWPENILFFGYRLSVLLILGGGSLLCAFAAYVAMIALGRRQEAVATRQAA